MTTSTLPAAQVVSALGRLPKWFLATSADPDTPAHLWRRGSLPARLYDNQLLLLSDEQTAFGVALLLDEGERARGNLISWACDLATILAFRLDDLPDTLACMVDRITAIALDHEVRRALGWTVEPGTLATLERCGANDWLMCNPVTGRGYTFTTAATTAGNEPICATVPALAGITDPSEALRAIHAKLTGGSDE